MNSIFADFADSVFGGQPVQIVPADTARYDEKPTGNEDQGWRDEN
ncbi:hypothetical protein [Streptomyces klenkii]